MENTLTQKQIESIVTHISKAEHQQLSLVAEPETLQGGMRRATYKFETDNNKAYVVSVSTHSLPASEQAHTLHTFLYNNGAQVARPVGGMGTLSLEGNDSSASFVVSEFVKGREGNSCPQTPEDFRAFGVAMAKLHAQTDAYFKAYHLKANDYSASWREGAKLIQNATEAEENELKRWFIKGTPIRNDIMRSAEDLRTLAVDLAGMTLKEGVVHRDANSGNVIIGEDGNAILIDTETCGKGVPAEDLAFAILWVCIDLKRENNETDVTIHQDKIDALLEGYQSVRPLDKNEIASVYALVKSDAKSYATRSNMDKTNPYLTPTDYITWSDRVGTWTDRIMQNRASNNDKSNANQL